MKKLPIGKQIFRQLIEGNFFYIDKTPWIVDLAYSEVPTFLSRPRRFGKSLTVNTFQELFRGNRKLFENTFAYDNWNFEKISPVIKLDMSVCSSDNIDVIGRKIIAVLNDIGDEYDVVLKEQTIPELSFRELIRKLGNNNRAVVLIDEYDAPLLDALGCSVLPEVKKLLRDFYKVLKEQEENIRYLFITGITRFSKLGVFSSLNNLRDITLHESYASICGYTRKEIEDNFMDKIKSVIVEMNLSQIEFWEQLKHYYNGYSWDGKTFLFNPFSILNFLDRKKFAPYWMESGSPSFMIHYADENKLDIDELEGVIVDHAFLSESDIDTASPESFLLQAGYLTIKEVKKSGNYILDFPNFEVRHSFNKLILKNKFKISDRDILGVTKAINNALEENNTEAMLEQFKIIFSIIPHYHYDYNKNEYFYSAQLLMFLQAAGFDVFPEKNTNAGRIDLLFYWKKKRIYIIELKVSSAQKAMDQIKEKDYASQFLNRECIKIGLAVDFKKRNIVDWVIE